MYNSRNLRCFKLSKYIGHELWIFADNLADALKSQNSSSVTEISRKLLEKCRTVSTSIWQWLAHSCCYIEENFKKVNVILLYLDFFSYKMLSESSNITWRMMFWMMCVYNRKTFLFLTWPISAIFFLRNLKVLENALRFTTKKALISKK